jgi:hypothetical protein
MDASENILMVSSEIQAAAREGLDMERAMESAWAGGLSGAADADNAAPGAPHTVAPPLGRCAASAVERASAMSALLDS